MWPEFLALHHKSAFKLFLYGFTVPWVLTGAGAALVVLAALVVFGVLVVVVLSTQY